MFFLKVRPRKHKKAAVDERVLHEALEQELGGFLKREELKGYIEKIHKDEQRRRLWESLSTRKQLQVLRYVINSKGVSDGKK